MSKNVIDFKTKKIEKALTDTTHEYCVICWTRTYIQQAVTIEFRCHYIEGVGQLCPTCYNNLYK